MEEFLLLIAENAALNLLSVTGIQLNFNPVDLGGVVVPV